MPIADDQAEGPAVKRTLGPWGRGHHIGIRHQQRACSLQRYPSLGANANGVPSLLPAWGTKRRRDKEYRGGALFDTQFSALFGSLAFLCIFLCCYFASFTARKTKPARAGLGSFQRLSARRALPFQLLDSISNLFQSYSLYRFALFWV